MNLNALDNRFLSTCSSRCTSVSMPAGTPVQPRRRSQLLFLSDRLKELSQIVGQSFDGYRFRPDLHVACLDFGQIEDVVDQVEQIIAGRLNRLRIFNLLVRQIVGRIVCKELARISDELSGVRSSWDMLARKSDLYRLACSSSRALSCTEALARCRSSRCASSCWVCSSSCEFVCSSSTCCCSSRA